MLKFIRNLSLSWRAETGFNLVRTFTGLEYEQNGQPEDVLRFGKRNDQEPGPGELLVDWLAAPINPADINQVQGVYAIRPDLPAIPGNEGVGVVRSIGPEVRAFSRGDWVVPLRPGIGTWREAGIHGGAALHKVPSDLPLGAAATSVINPPTAKRLLEDIVTLQPGDSIIQNGANSFVGQLLIQIAARKNIKTINLVRDRPEIGTLIAKLKGLGADIVSTEGSLREDVAKSGFAKPQLAINSVGGKMSTAIAKTLGKDATLVTYGGLSKQPVTLPTGPFIFKGLKAQGFWLSGGGRTEDEAAQDIDESAALWLEGSLKAEFEYFDLEDFKAALTNPSRDLLARKRILLTPKGREIWAKQEAG